MQKTNIRAMFMLKYNHTPTPKGKKEAFTKVFLSSQFIIFVLCNARERTQYTYR